MKRFSKLFLVLAIFCFAFVLSACGEVKVTISTDGNDLLIKPNESIQLNVDVQELKDYLESDIEYEIISGPATVSESGLLKINANADAGAEIKIKCKIKGYESNVITISVESIALTSITASATTTNIQVGGRVKLSYALAPTNTTDKNITWSIVGECNFAEIIDTANGKYLLIDNSATIGSSVQVKATSAGSVNSNTLTFNVVASLTGGSILTSNTVQVSPDALTGSSITPELVYEIGGQDTTATFECVLAEGGDDIVEIDTADNKTFTLTSLGHGTTTATFSAVGRTGVATKIITINSNVAPISIKMPEFLPLFDDNENSAKYSVGVSTPILNQEFDFVPTTTKGEYTSVCNDFVYSFKLFDGDSYNDSTTCASVSNGKIRFNETGLIEVTVKSAIKDSITVKYLFDVNEYRNVYNYEELKTYAEACTPVNIVVTSKPAEGYGYDLVPSFLLNLDNYEGDENQRANAIYNDANNARIIINPKSIVREIESSEYEVISVNSVIINGNGHKINVSKLPVFTTNFGFNLDALFMVSFTQESMLKQTGSGELVPVTQRTLKAGEEDFSYNYENDLLDLAYYNININNISFLGNIGINGNGVSDVNMYSDEGIYKYTYREGIQISGNNDARRVFLNMENVTVEKFNIGMRLNHTVPTEDGTKNSTLKNVKISDCYKSGMELSACLIDLDNIEFGVCGQGTIEITPDNNTQAGINFNTAQSINILSLKNNTVPINDYTTQFFNNFLGGATIIQLLGASLSGHTEIMPYVVQEYETESGDNKQGVGFIGLVFHPLNTGVIVGVNAEDVVDATDAEFATKVENAKYIRIVLASNYGYIYMLNVQYDYSTPQE